jgi:hypothetical protein
MMENKNDRIDHIFQFMEYDNLTDDQHSLIIKYEEFYNKNSFLTEKQMDVLESIFKQAAEK